MGIKIGDMPFGSISLSDYSRFLDESSEKSYRKQADIKNLWYSILCVFDRLSDDDMQLRMTVRQMFYALVSVGKIEKAESAYRKVSKQLSIMRREGYLPFHWIVDNTRWQRKPDSYKDLNVFLSNMQDYYRKSIWNEQGKYIEIWVEKDALTGVFYPTTSKYDVPLMSAKGFASDSFIFGSAEAIKEEYNTGKDVFLYYFGDYDPSGYAAVNATYRKLKEFAGGDIKFGFEHVAVKKEHIEYFNLPTRPTKQSDTRAKKWDGDSVELDAIPPRELQKMIENCIVRHIDENLLNKTKLIENNERESLKQFTESLIKINRVA